MPSDAMAATRAWFDGLEHGELGLELCHPAIEIRNWENIPVTGPYVGHEGVRRWWDDFSEAFGDLRWELTEMIDLGHGRILTLQRLIGRFAHTGIELDHEWGAIITVEEGLITSATGYATPGRARRAAGVPRER